MAKHGVLMALVCSSILAAGCAGEGQEPGETEAEAHEVNSLEASGDGPYMHWRSVRAVRQARVDLYNAEHADQYASFKNAALGTSGIPMVMLRLFPELFPHIWGPTAAHFAPAGLAEDTLEPGRVLPLGIGDGPSEPALPTAPGSVQLHVV